MERQLHGYTVSFEVWSVYVTAVLVLMSTPGPSHLLMLSNSATNGFKRSLATAAGDLTANALQMLAAGIGVAALIAASGHALSLIKWLGVAYLIWLGFRMIRGARNERSVSRKPAQTSLKVLWLQGFITSAANPKAIVFFAALFPLFIEEDRPFPLQFAILSVTYLVLDGLFLSVYGIGANWISSHFRGSALSCIARLGGGFIIGAAILLGFKTIKDSS